MKPIVTSGAGLNSSKVGTPRCGVRTAQRAVPTIEMKNLVVRLVTSRLARLLPIAASLLSFLAAPAPAGAQTNLPPEIRTPKPPAVPRIERPGDFWCPARIALALPHPRHWRPAHAILHPDLRLGSVAVSCRCRFAGDSPPRFPDRRDDRLLDNSRRSAPPSPRQKCPWLR